MILLADGHGVGEERLLRVALGPFVSLDVMVHVSGQIWGAPVNRKS